MRTNKVKIPKWEKIKNWRNEIPPVVAVPQEARCLKASFLSAEADGSWSTYSIPLEETKELMEDYEIALYQRRGNKLYLVWQR